MAYGRKYYKEFDGYNAATSQSYPVLVDIYEDGFAGSSIEIEEISASPLQLSLDSSGDPLYTAIKKTSATFNIINTNQFDYSEFYTSNAKKYKMMITSPVFNWTGYLVPQAVSFDLATNGEFSLTASDGLHLLQSIDYVAAENDMTTLAAFLSDIEAKIGLSTFNRTSTISTEYGDIWNSLIYEGMFTNKTYEEAFEMVLKAIGMQVRYWKITPIISIESALQTASVKCVNDYPELNFIAPIKTAKLTKNIITLPSAFKNALVDDISDLKPRVANSYNTLTNWTVVSDNGLVVFDIGANKTDRKANKYKAINMFVKPTNATYDTQRLTGNEGSYFQLRPVQKTPFTLSFNANFGRISEYGRSSADGYRAYIHHVKWSSIKWGLYDSISNKSYSKTTNSWSIAGTPTSANANELKVTDPADSFVDVYIPIPAPTGLTANLRFYLFTGAVEYVNAAPVGESRTNRLSISSIDIDGEYVVSENELYTAVNGAVAVGDNIDVLDYDVDFGSVPVPPLNTSLYYGSAFFDNNLNQLEDIIIGANTVSHEQYLFNTILYTQNEIRKKVYTANVNMLTNVSPFWLKTTLKTDNVMVNACSFDFKTSQLNGEFTEIMPYVYREWAITSESEIGSSDWGGSGGQTGTSGGGGTVDTSNFVKKTGETSQTIEGDIIVNGNIISTGEVSAYGAGTGTGGGSGLITSVLGSAGLGGSYLDSDLTNTFNAYTINLINNNLTSALGRIGALETSTPNVAWGTATSQYSPLTINSVTRNLSVDGHVHNNLYVSPSRYIVSDTSWYISAMDGGTIHLETNGQNPKVKINQYVYDIYHSGNFNPSNYLPLTGGDLTGNISIISGNVECGVRFGGVDNAGDFVGRYSSYISLYNKNNPSQEFKIPDIGGATIGGNTIWHSGNDGAGSGLDANLLEGLHGSEYLRKYPPGVGSGSALDLNNCSGVNILSGYNVPNSPYAGDVSILTIPIWNGGGKYSTQFIFGMNTSVNPYFRRTDINGDGVWRQMAFLNDNVASATKLANTRYIWGNAFTGEGDVTGRITFSNYDTHIAMPIGYIGCNTGDSYFWNYSNHPIKFGTNDLERMRIAPTGNVLIGTSTDSGYKLDVNGTFRTTGAAYLNSTLEVTSYATANRFYTGYDSGLANSISCSNWFRTDGATGWMNDTYVAGVCADTYGIVRTYNTNKFKVYNTEADSIYTLGGLKADGNSTLRGITLSNGTNTRNMTVGSNGGIQIAGVIDSFTYSLPATIGWYRVAVAPVGIERPIGQFDISWTLGGYHGAVSLTAGIMYASSPFISQSAYTTYGTCITKSRIVYHTTHSGNYAYLEIYNETGNAVSLTVKGYNLYNWSLYSASTVGSIPSGYSNKEITHISGYMTSGNVAALGEITAYSASDERLKENIKPLTNSLSIIESMNPVSYNWNNIAKELNPLKSDNKDFGLVAQELETIVPELVHTIYGGQYKSIDYVKIIPHLICAIKQLKTEVDILKNNNVICK